MRLTDRQCDACRSLTELTSTSRPSRMIPTRSHARSTSGRLCDERNTVRPAARTSATIVRNSRCIKGSRPLVGSSITRSGSSPMNACTTPTFCRFPRESLRTCTVGSRSRRWAIGSPGPGRQATQAGHVVELLAGRQLPEVGRIRAHVRDLRVRRWGRRSSSRGPGWSPDPTSDAGSPGGPGSSWSCPRRWDRGSRTPRPAGR